MPGFLLGYMRTVDRLNYGVGRFAMYLLYVLMGILLWSSISKATGSPSLWTLEVAQFVMVGYYILGGPYSMQEGAHVRMDLLYADWSPQKKAFWDSFTVLALIFYLCVMLWGAIDSTVYSLGLKYTPIDVAWLPFDIPWAKTGFMERAPSSFRPYLWPVKVVMCIGFVLMILQATSCLIRDVATIRGVKV
jgi:TRAP-type mannitol/chloroaromatic compound transport system permease small subunit